MKNSLHSVYLFIQMPAAQMDWLCENLAGDLKGDERMWLTMTQEVGPNAKLATPWEKVTGHAKTGECKILCSAERAQQLVTQLQSEPRLPSWDWQIQSLTEAGHHSWNAQS